MSLPSTEGVMPIFDSLMAFSIGFIVEASKGWMTMSRGSGVLISASCLSYMTEP